MFEMSSTWLLLLFNALSTGKPCLCTDHGLFGVGGLAIRALVKHLQLQQGKIQSMLQYMHDLHDWKQTIENENWTQPICFWLCMRALPWGRMGWWGAFNLRSKRKVRFENDIMRFVCHTVSSGCFRIQVAKLVIKVSVVSFVRWFGLKSRRVKLLEKQRFLSSFGPCASRMHVALEWFVSACLWQRTTPGLLWVHSWNEKQGSVLGYNFKCGAIAINPKEKIMHTDWKQDHVYYIDVDDSTPTKVAKIKHIYSLLAYVGHEVL